MSSWHCSIASSLVSVSSSVSGLSVSGLSVSSLLGHLSKSGSTSGRILMKGPGSGFRTIVHHRKNDGISKALSFLVSSLSVRGPCQSDRTSAGIFLLMDHLKAPSHSCYRQYTRLYHPGTSAPCLHSAARRIFSQSSLPLTFLRSISRRRFL